MLPLKHKFYSKTQKEQLFFYLKLALLASVIILLAILIAVWTKAYALAIFILPLLMTIIAPFVDTPTLAKQGKLTYYSTLFLAENKKKNKVTIHGGTLFDYYFVLDRSLNGNQRTKIILWSYLRGLLNLLEEFEQAPNPDILIRGTSYIINERTAQKIGLKAVHTDSLQYLILAFNYFQLTFAYSLAKAKLSFPNLNNIKTYEGKLVDICEKKSYLIKLEQKLQESLKAPKNHSKQ